MVAHASRPGRDLNLQQCQPVLRGEERPGINDNEPGGHYKLDLDYSYDRWVLGRAVTTSHVPKDAPCTHSRRVENLVVYGQRQTNLQPSSAQIESMRGKASLDLVTSLVNSRQWSLVEVD